MPDLTMSPRGHQLCSSLSRTFALIEEHARTHPHEVEILWRAVVSHLRSSRPQLLAGGEL